jgi:hypothetical protein
VSFIATRWSCVALDGPATDAPRPARVAGSRSAAQLHWQTWLRFAIGLVIHFAYGRSTRCSTPDRPHRRGAIST